MTSGKKILLVVVALAVLVAVPLAMHSKRGGDVKQVQVEKVEARIISPTILASGSLIYQTEIRIMSEVMGRVKELFVKEGEQVEKGHLLLRLDPATVQAQVDRLEAGLQQSRLNIERARVSAATAETKWSRYQKLRESGVIDANTYDEVRSQRDQSKVELDSTLAQTRQTEASLKEARGQLAKTELRAPISGRLTAVKIKIGETAVPSATSIAGSDLLVIADTTNLYAEVNVNETDVARVVPGQEARIVPAAFPDKAWKGTVETVAVSPVQVQGQGKSYLVKIRLTKSDELQFHTGMSCRAEIVTRGTDATPVIAVPVQALQYEEAKERDEVAKSSIFVMVDGKARKHDVDAGVADDTYVAITKGVEAGAQIITGPSKVLRFLREGDRVSPVAADADASGGKTAVKKESPAPAAKP
ncbi:MAG: efflux RND transporter periplasmic adaptor subunit [Steroidobacteraceae bacterium]